MQANRFVAVIAQRWKQCRVLSLCRLACDCCADHRRTEKLFNGQHPQGASLAVELLMANIAAEIFAVEVDLIAYAIGEVGGGL
jgi:hypothetical protein